MTRLLLAFALLGCSSNEPAAATAEPLSFAKDIVPILNRSCGAGDNACHSRVAFHPNKEQGCRGWLALEDAPLGSVDPKDGTATGCPDVPLYERLTQLDAWECGPPYFAMFPARKYVQPGQPEASHLLNKMNGGPQCGVNAVMPKGGKADPAEVEIITRWIKAGAPR